MDKPIILLVTVIICIIIIYKYNEKPMHHHIHINTPPINNQPITNQPISERAINVSVQPQPNPYPQPSVMLPDPITNIDLRNINDPLTGPIRRPTRDAIGPMVGNPLFNIYTQGPPDSYSWLGILTSNPTSETVDKNNKLLKLFGRQRYPNSTTWDYYVQAYTGGASGDTIKISLDKDKYRKELYDDDNVYVKELGMNYNVKLNRDDVFTYNPYLI
jgi:hypothetical protein